tara:strand:- start:871 stop:2154 length:1284 start_codon:yes stop_codon:yes gene_type:complete
MRRIIIPLALLVVVSLSALLVAFMPYHFYYVALDNGLNSRFLKTNKVPEPFLSTKKLELEKVELTSSDSLIRWRNFHVGNYILPLPVRHPYFLLVPDITLDQNQKPIIAWDLQNQNLKAEISLKFLSSIAYTYPFEENLLFNLPVVKNHILDVPSQTIWRDLFTLDLRLPAVSQDGIIPWVQKLWAIGYNEIAYKLFILKTRQLLFPADVTKLSYDESKQMGVIEMKPAKTDDLVDDNTKVEVFYLLREGLVQRLQLTTRRYSKIAQAYRTRAIEGLEWKVSNPDETVQIYNEFNKLSYEQKVDQEGMTYLFAGWTHVPKQEEFLRTMIQFLERGKRNKVHLKSLYQYGYDLFGTSFSSQKENLRETEQRKLERKISEELKGEFNRAEKTEVVAPDGNFVNEQDQVDFFLKKAKESGTRDDSNILTD